MHESVTLEQMPPRKKKAKEPKIARIFIETSEELKAALEALAEDEGRTIKAQVERCLRESLAGKGYWPWPRPGSEPDARQS